LSAFILTSLGLFGLPFGGEGDGGPRRELPRVGLFDCQGSGPLN
jgi:hypothetical protein